MTFTDILNRGHLSLALLVLTYAAALVYCVSFKRRKGRIVTPLNILIFGTFLSALAFFTPLLNATIKDFTGKSSWFEALLNAAQYSFRLFILDGELLWIEDLNFEPFNIPKVKSFYFNLGSVLYASAPVLTFGFIASMFMGLLSRIRYFFSAFLHAHVFSELNEKSLALAKDIHTKSEKYFKTVRKDVIVFTEMSDKKYEDSEELIEEAHAIGAILLNTDFELTPFKHRFSKRKLTFYLISDDEDSKLRCAEHVMRRYDSKDVNLYIFSDDKRSELMMASETATEMKVRRINDIQALVYYNLYTNGKMLFDRAREIDGKKVISAVILGLGKYGTEMLKALCWFCQIKGYELKINAFDADENAESKFSFICSELMSPKYNRVKTAGEPSYDITIHSRTDVSTQKFKDELSAIDDATYVFVCLGDDEANLKAAADARMIYEGVFKNGPHKPDIEAIVYDASSAAKMGIGWQDIKENRKAGVTNFSNQPYNIIMTGSLDSFYTVDVLFNFEAEKEGLKAHKLYRDEASFWRYEYNRKSSIARAMHRKLRTDMGCFYELPSVEEWQNYTDEQKIEYADHEHIRWSAYMRTEGYSWSGSLEKTSRNDLAKLHNFLVPTKELPDEELRKD